MISSQVLLFFCTFVIKTLAKSKNIQNVDKIYDEYGEKYPVVVEQRKDKNVVLIGPLSVDEYGTVVQRFKSFGFKDAFIRKGK